MWGMRRKGYTKYEKVNDEKIQILCLVGNEWV